MEYLKRFENLIIVALTVMMMLVVFLATLELGWILIKDIISPPLFLLEINELLEVFGLFLLVLIGVELLETLITYLTKKKIHLEVVLTLAMIAISRKVIILDVKELPNLTLLGMAAIILALSVGYYLFKRGEREAGSSG